MRIRELWSTVAKKVVDNSVVKSNRPGAFFAFVSVVAMAASMLVGTNIASADQVQVQSYQRANQTEACVAQPGETPWQASWGSDSSWYPSWEQWANKGMGGWVCTRSITWARSTPSARSYSVGDIGPGGGLVFLISGGLTYEMAPKSWGVNETTGIGWCSDTTSAITGANGLAVGTGSANTTAMQSPACTTGAGVAARAYRGGGFSDWFLPSQDELNAMYTYSLVGGFNSATYGFSSGAYWSSSQYIALTPPTAWAQIFGTGFQGHGDKSIPFSVRPIRAF